MKKQNFDTIFCDALKCNHCGLCLQNCPAYRTYKQEGYGPRGRVQIAAFLAKKKLTLKQDKNEILTIIKTCQNCNNCTVLCPTGISPQDINERLKNILNIKEEEPKTSLIKNILFKIYFRKFFTKKDNLFLTSSTNFKQIKQSLEMLKDDGFESTLYKEIVTHSLRKLPNFKTYIFDDIEIYRLIKNAIIDGKINLNPKQILFITQILKPKTVKLPEDSLIILSNIYLTQETKEEERKLFQIFKNKTLNFINNRYYYGPNYHPKTVEYLKNIPQKTLITLSARENKFLNKLIKKYKIDKKVELLANLLS
ncbi:MAG: 4Fe-4S dicluster domain-containing protein [Elusimicrobiaceae bacterium]|nr:4Fe-4S dicluster domain-containing protein [Elusimicrobiaceae bacterium]